MIRQTFNAFKCNVIKLSRRHYRVSSKDLFNHCFSDTQKGIKTETLPNGLRVATQETMSGLASISLIIQSGPRFEKACNNGLTHFIEHMAFKGFRSMDKAQIENALLEIGAKVTAHTTREYQVFSVICPSEASTTVLDMLVRFILEPDISDCEIELEKCNICREMVDHDNDPKAVVFDYLHQTAFQGTSLGQRVIGSQHNIRCFDSCLLLKFMCQNYTPWRLTLAASGGVNHDNVMAKISPLSLYAPNTKCQADYGYSRYTGSSIIYRDDSMPHCHLAIAFEVSGYCNQKDFLPLHVAKCIIGEYDVSQGGGEGNVPTLARAAAVDHSFERYESFYIPYKDVGLWGVYVVAAKGANLDDVVFNIQDQLKHMIVTTVWNDVDRGINKYKLNLAKTFQNCMTSSVDIGLQMHYWGVIKSMEKINAELNAVREDTITALEKYIYNKCPVVVAIGPTETLPDYIKIRAGTYWMRL